MSESRPNILLITTDQQRFDALGINGDGILQTQNLDAMAAKGVNFTRAYTTCPSCIAARRTILTGQKPSTHGLVGYSETAPFNPSFTLPGLLGEVGYQTQLVGKLHQLPQRRRFGFDNMILSNAPAHRPDSEWQRENDYIDWLKEQGVRTPSNSHGLNGNGRLARPFQLDEYHHHSTYLTTKAIEFMTRKRDPSCPFFLHLSYWAPHPPLIPPQAYYDRYKDRDDLKPKIGSWVPEFDSIPAGLRPDENVGPFRGSEIQNAMAGYYGLINHIDDQIQRLMEAYYVYGNFSRSQDPMYIIFTSDHGEMLGDHHLFRKSLAYEGSSHVPFFIFGRNVPCEQAESNELVCLEDLLPTCCELGGAEIPEGVDGVSLAPWIRGEKVSTREVLHGEHSGRNGNHFLLNGKYKYIWHTRTNEEQLFDLENDPYEMEDLSGQKDHLKKMRSRMQEQLKGRSDYTYDVNALTPCRNRPPVAFWS